MNKHEEPVMKHNPFVLPGRLLSCAALVLSLALPVAALAEGAPKSGLDKVLETKEDPKLSKAAQEAAQNARASNSAQEAARNDAKTADAQNPKNPPATGADPKAPAVGNGRDAAALVGGGRNTSKDPAAVAAEAAQGVGAARGQANSSLSGSKTQAPGFKQGFRDKPTSVDAATAEAAAANAGNPMQGLTGGGVGGSGPSGIAAQGTSAISDGGSDGKGGAGIIINGASVITGGTPNSTVNPDTAQKENPFKAQRDEKIASGIKGDVTPRAIQMDSALCDSGDESACARQSARQSEASKTEQTPATGGAGGTTAADPNFKVHPSGNTTEQVNGGQTQSGGSTSYTTSDASGRRATQTTIKNNSDGTTTVTKTTFDKDGNVTGTSTRTGDTPSATPAPANPGTSCAGIDGCKGQPRHVPSAAEAAQIRQSKSGGSGDIDPGSGGDAIVGAPVSGVVAPSQSAVGQSLFGNPGQAGGLQEGGAGRGLDFNGNLGATDPGPDGTVTVGNRQDTRAQDARSGSPTRDLPAQSGCDDDGSTADTADDCPNP